MEFIDSLEPKLRDKLIRQILHLSRAKLPDLKEPHYKHFVIERYRELFELRERGKVLIRIIFTLRPDGGIILLHAFLKRQSRDTMKALEQALKILSRIRDCPDRVVEFKVREEACR